MKKTVLALMMNTDSLPRTVLNRALGAANYGVVWAATPQEAIEASNRCHVDLVLLDLNQPLRQGWDIFERVTAHNPTVPVVILTERRTEFEEAAASQVGALLAKPFSAASLVHIVNVLLGLPAQPHLAGGTNQNSLAQTT